MIWLNYSEIPIFFIKHKENYNCYVISLVYYINFS